MAKVRSTALKEWERLEKKKRKLREMYMNKPLVTTEMYRTAERVLSETERAIADDVWEVVFNDNATFTTKPQPMTPVKKKKLRARDERFDALAKSAEYARKEYESSHEWTTPQVGMEPTMWNAFKKLSYMDQVYVIEHGCLLPGEQEEVKAPKDVVEETMELIIAAAMATGSK